LRHLTIVCFTFPPYEGIGGRRWAKFAKYLHNEGVGISIIAANKQILESKSNWLNDTLAYTDKINFLPMHYPAILTTIPNGLLQKLHYRLAWIYVKFLIKGNYFDYSSFFSKQLLQALEKNIQNGTSQIILSCAPFHMAYAAIKLKQKYPQVTFIVDFRDPWTTNKSSFGFTGLSSKRLEYEKYKEKSVIENYDKVFSVSNEMTDYFKSLISMNIEKCITIPNGFDRDDFVHTPTKTSSKLRFVFAGSLYDKAFHIFSSFIDALKQIEQNNPIVYNKLAITIAGYAPNVFLEEIKSCEIIQHVGVLSLQETYNLLSNSDVSLLFLTDDLNYTFSTKFYEYIAMNLPIAVCSTYGHTSDYVKEHKLGYALTPDKMYETILEIIHDWQNNQLIRNDVYNIDTHNIQTIVKQKLKPILDATS